MDVVQTKLGKAQPNSNLIKIIKDLIAEAENFKAPEGARRLVFVCDNYDHLTPETAYRWLDPLAFQHEVEEARAQRVWFWHLLRNCVSILPLIMTWFALFQALKAFQLDTYAGDAGKSFLQLWQEGFHGGTWLTFSTAAAIDVVLLVSYLILIAVTSWTDGRAYTRSTKFAEKLQTTTEELMRVIANSPSISVDKSAIQNVASAVQQVVDNAMRANQQFFSTTEQSVRQLMQATQDTVTQIVQISQKAIIDSNDRAERQFSKTDGIINKFDVNVQELQRILTGYQTKLDDLQDAIQQLTTASAGLVTNADRYTQIGQDISKNIADLNRTQANVLQQIGFIAKGITDAASEMNKSAINMEGAARQVEKVATQLDSGIQATLRTMHTEVSRSATSMSNGVQQSVNSMQNGVSQTAQVIQRLVTDATNAVQQVAPVLQQTADALEDTTNRLASLAIAGAAGLNGSGGASSGGPRIGGIVGWLIGPGKKRQGKGKP
jgi:hypothetical protein